ncbi:hypothetical protein ACK6D9_13370 [Hoeflea sp. Naph1]|uniref:hypothetical protein n=1 Tax=Hoeflea sp. Naph1 TaxID=3388653 RepID=UPI00398FBC11
MTIKHNDAIEKSIEDAPVSTQKEKPTVRDDSIHHGLLAFETRYEEAQRKKAEREAGPVGPEGCRPKTTRQQIEAGELRRMVHERLENGYVLPFTTEIAGRHRQPFVELGLNSP